MSPTKGVILPAAPTSGGRMEPTMLQLPLAAPQSLLIPPPSIPLLGGTRLLVAAEAAAGDLKTLSRSNIRMPTATVSRSRYPRLKPLHSQRRPRNDINEDTDEMFSDLFDKYGKVVYRRSDQKPPTAEADDDAESLSFAVTIAKVASEVKAADIRVLFVKPLVYWTRFFIIATAFSRPQIDAIGSRVRDAAEKQFRRVATGDTKPNSWTLLDFGDVVVHIFLPEQRSFYNLEEFYGNATPVELPFDTQSPPSFHG